MLHSAPHLNGKFLEEIVVALNDSNSPDNSTRKKALITLNVAQKKVGYTSALL